MNKKYIIVADSALELLLSIQVKLTLLKDDIVDIILTDRTNGTKEVYLKLREKKVFQNVYYAEANCFPYGKYKKFIPESLQQKLYNSACKRGVNKILGKKQKYNHFITAETDYFSRNVYKVLKEDNASPILLGEGILPYCGLEANLLSRLGTADDDLIRDYECIWVYGPQIRKMAYAELLPIPSVMINKEKLVEILNYIYDYKPHKHVYENKIIFFEESYSTDGGSDNAVEFIQKLITWYRKEQIVIKRHPRDVEDRFTDMGIQTVEPYSIPWEVFLLNGDCRNCVLLSANSGSVYLAKLWDFTDETLSCIMLAKILKYEYGNSPMLIEYYNFLEETFYKQYNYCVPKDMEELHTCIEASIKQTFKLEGIGE